MSSWRLAQSLQVLCDEVHAISPQTEIGTIGDAAHQAEASDHNPNGAGVVCAADIMQGFGLDLAHIAETVRTSGHPDLAYVIHNRQIASRKSGLVWKPYTGSDPHTNHVHVSVGTGSDGHRTPPYDDPNGWGVARREHDMTLYQGKGCAAVYVSDGVHCRWIQSPAEFANLQHATGQAINVVDDLACAGYVIGPVFAADPLQPIRETSSVTTPGGVLDAQALALVLAPAVADLLAARLKE